MKCEIMDFITDYASQNYESQILNSSEYSELFEEITALQEDIRKSGLPEEQSRLVKQLLKDHHDLALGYIAKMYRQAMIDCVTLLRELKIL